VARPHLGIGLGLGLGLGIAGFVEAETSLLSVRMVSRISHTAIDCRDAFQLSAWWKPVLGYEDVPGDPNEVGHDECMIVDLRTGHRLLFIEVPDARSVKNRLHFDLAPNDRTRDEEVDRIVALGARVIADLRNADGSGWVVLQDPEGNEFCVLRSDAERTA
jgi:catechol 2,3-dioxygenase-like lactoylglutathione lyase family enzyme